MGGMKPPARLVGGRRQRAAEGPFFATSGQTRAANRHAFFGDKKTEIFARHRVIFAEKPSPRPRDAHMPTAPLPQLPEMEDKLMKDNETWFEKLYGNDDTKTRAHVVTVCRLHPSERRPNTPAVAQYKESVEEMFEKRPELVEKLQKQNGYDLWGLTVTQGSQKKSIERFLFHRKEEWLEIPRRIRLSSATRFDDPDNA